VKLKIIKDNNPLMRKRSEEVPLPLSKEDKNLLDDMLLYLKRSQDEEYAKKHGIRAGVGLAAIQVGVLKRMFVVYIKNGEEEIAYQFVNPKIIESSVKLCALEGGEGCLSVDGSHPGLSHRAYKIKLKAYEALTDEDVVLEARGYLSIVLQHEYDHLNGMFFYDRIDKDHPNDPKPSEELI